MTCQETTAATPAPVQAGQIWKHRHITLELKIKQHDPLTGECWVARPGGPDIPLSCASIIDHYRPVSGPGIIRQAVELATTP